MRTPSYHEYLRLDRILDSQRPPDFESAVDGADRDLIHKDELLFIVMHQTMELWFKMVLSDVESARDLIGRPGHSDRGVPEEDIPRVCSHLNRSALLMKHLTDQFAVIETMPPTHFLTFRDQLIPSSGFQSWQFRELEVLAGLPEDERIDYEGKPYYAHMPKQWRAGLDRRRRELSLREVVFQWLARTPVEEAFPGFADVFHAAYCRYVDDQLRLQQANPNLSEARKEALAMRFEDGKAKADRFLNGGSDIENRARRAFIFISTYRHHPLLRWPHAVLERALEFEEHFRLFRFRHARMVERVIGLRVGSGGSSGVEYLDSTASSYRIFGGLLEGVSYLIDETRLPAVPHAEILKFRIQG